MNEFKRVAELEGHEEVLDIYLVNKKGQIFSEYLNGFLKPSIKDNGYIQYKLKVKGERRWKHVHAHRVVAYAFIPNPNNYPVVHHIDEDKQNNVVDNLEWCTQKYNANAGTAIQRLKESITGERLFVYDFKGDEVLRGYGVSESTKRVLGRKRTEVKNKRAGDYFFLSEEATPNILNEINEKSKSKTLVVRDTIADKSILFPNNKEVKEFLGGTINVTDAINKKWLTQGRYVIEVFNFNEKDSPNLR